VRRREFIVGFGGAAAMPFAARAQQGAVPVIGALSGVLPSTFAKELEVFRKSLAEVGYVIGQNVQIEYRWAEGHYDWLPKLAADLVARRVTVIFAHGTITSAQAAKAATVNIPIVFLNGGDPVEDGLVASLNRPGGNVTGVTFFSNVLWAKRFGLLLEITPAATTIAVLVNPRNARAASDIKNAQDATQAAGKQLVILNASTEHEVGAAFETLKQRGGAALLVNADAFLNGRRQQLATLAAQYAVPTMYPWREAIAAGGLIRYGAKISDAFHQSGIYVGRVLKGEKPGDLPVLQPSKFELIVNLKAAKAMGLKISEPFLLTADEVIE
jgi:putative ABC transport system substrate-binding protein